MHWWKLAIWAVVYHSVVKGDVRILQDEGKA